MFCVCLCDDKNFKISQHLRITISQALNPSLSVGIPDSNRFKQRLRGPKQLVPDGDGELTGVAEHEDQLPYPRSQQELQEEDEEVPVLWDEQLRVDAAPPAGDDAEGSVLQVLGEHQVLLHEERQ